MPRSALFAAALLPALALAVAGPGQLSLAVTANGPTEMAVTWASLIAWTPAATANVSWWPTAQPQAVSSAASWRTQTYTAGFGWTGTLFAATMTGLVPGASYSYSVTDATGNASAATTFHAAPAPAADAAVRIGVLADMGTIELMGWDVAALVIREHQAQAFDAFFISGDLSSVFLRRQISCRARRVSERMRLFRCALVDPPHVPRFLATTATRQWTPRTTRSRACS